MKTHKKDNLVATFVPYYERNPYQDRLVEGLTSCGVCVEKVRSSKDIFKAAFLSRPRPDILHLHWLPSFARLRAGAVFRLGVFITTLCLLRVLGTKMVWTVHNLVPHKARNRRCELLIRRLVVRIVHGLIAHTKAAKDDIVATLRVKDHEKIFVIPHGNYIGCYKNEIDRLQARRQLGIDDSKTVMLFFGVIDPYKGTEELIEAFKALEPEPVHLLVVGRCSEDELAQSITGRIQGRGNITFVGEFVADDKIQVFMNASDVVVLPYRTMLTSGAAILAMSFGKACVAPGRGFFREVLDNTGTIFYQPNSDGCLLGALRTAVERSSDLREMGEHNKKRSGRWDWHTVAAMTVDVYRRVYGQGGELPAAIDQTNAMDSLAAEPVVEESPL